MLYAYFTDTSLNRKAKITDIDDVYYNMECGSEKKLKSLAKREGKKFAHLYEQQLNGDEIEYVFITTTEVL